MLGFPTCFLGVDASPWLTFVEWSFISFSRTILDLAVDLHVFTLGVDDVTTVLDLLGVGVTGAGVGVEGLSFISTSSSSDIMMIG